MEIITKKTTTVFRSINFGETEHSIKYLRISGFIFFFDKLNRSDQSDFIEISTFYDTFSSKLVH